MKKTLIYISFLGLALVLPLQAKAETVSPATKSTEKVVISSDKQQDETAINPNTDQSLSVRKDKVEADFKSLIAQLSIFISRTQNILDRLSIKGIDTGKTQDELILANKSLLDAKNSLDVFSSVVITETKQEKASNDLKVSAKKTEDSLRESRLHLINALSILKDALNITTNES